MNSVNWQFVAIGLLVFVIATILVTGCIADLLS
jgi:hypothetical protein